MRNRKIAARIQAALERNQTRQRGVTAPSENPLLELGRIQSNVDRRLDGERNWKVKELAKRENVGYTTVFRALNGGPGWLEYGRTIRVTDTLYRSWSTAMAIGMSLDEFLSLPKAS